MLFWAPRSRPAEFNTDLESLLSQQQLLLAEDEQVFPCGTPVRDQVGAMLIYCEESGVDHN